ncbi:uncharacterized protein ARMOST_14644 [Armillaria ostoyae]|uniref:Uncharacterized protein n=1 Tax=Armillaria ostoyae TaxID=47428 RepID=A0A284RR54_ARMOS|nr:uncharacterized protein ARMOST_14644 [Armillaria ostoyae]
MTNPELVAATTETASLTLSVTDAIDTPSTTLSGLPSHRPWGRPRKYHTADEKAGAHALAQQGYYERNREVLCWKACRHYAPSSSDNHEHSRRHVASKEARQPRRPSAAYPSVQKTATLDDWKAGIEKNQAQLNRHLNNQPPAMLAAAVCSRTCEAHVTDPCAVISDALKPFNRLHNRISLITTSIYRRMGCTNLWKVAEKLCTQVQEVVDLLQDLLCSALSGVSELRTAFSEGTLAYQQA